MIIYDQVQEIITNVDDKQVQVDDAAWNIIEPVEISPEQVAASALPEGWEVGRLVTLSQDGYPGLGEWFAQIWCGDDVVARIYGKDHEQIQERIDAIHTATPQPAERQESVPKGWRSRFLKFMGEMQSELDECSDDPIPSEIWSLWRELLDTAPQPAPDVSALVEALEWYAEHAAGCRKISSEGDKYRGALDRDGGSIAETALSAYREYQESKK